MRWEPPREGRLAWGGVDAHGWEEEALPCRRAAAHITAGTGEQSQPTVTQCPEGTFSAYVWVESRMEHS